MLAHITYLQILILVLVSKYVFACFQNPAAPSPLGQMPPQDGGMPGAGMPPGFFPVSTYQMMILLWSIVDKDVDCV